MGVPKFFRWISARYPCINLVVHADQESIFMSCQVLRLFDSLPTVSKLSTQPKVPGIDHFYLDMNGILHTCSHPDDGTSFMTEETIFQNIKSYIQFLVQLIRPQKTLFLAVDGVAPRAKMTQQRARRFQSVQEARTAKANAEKRGEVTEGEPFDPCVISPGKSKTRDSSWIKSACVET
ncbi:hypothetical protein AHF37_01266 [Paragonimus kellicotti]|nr:hypothetical protein AHF37_01266 [Paragonimus kellicotti]